MTRTSTTTPLAPSASGTPAAAPPASGTPAAASPSGTLSPLALTVLLVAFVPVNYTFGAVNIALPSIGTDLSASAGMLGLVLAVYTTTFAATLVVGGRLGDRFGRRRALAAGLVGFVVLSVASALVTSAVQLVVVRGALGVASGVLAPQVLATIQETTRGPGRARAVALFVAVSGGATVVGQVLGGVVLAAASPHAGWRLVQVAGAAVALVGLAGLRAVPATRSTVRSLDLPGAALLAPALLALVVPLTVGSTHGWPAWSLVLLAAAVALVAAFVLRERHTERAGLVALVPPSVVREPTVALGLTMVLLFFVGYGAFSYEVASYTQHALGLSAFGSAMTVLLFAATFITTSLLVPRVARRLGPSTMPLASLVQVVTLVALAALVATVGFRQPVVQPLLAVLGVSQAVMYGPVLAAVLARTPTWAAGAVSGLFTTVQQLGLSFGVALLGGLYVAVSAHATTGAGAGGAGTSGAVHGLGVGFAVALAVQAATAAVFGLLALRITRVEPSERA